MSFYKNQEMKKRHILKAEKKKVVTHEHEYFEGLGFNERDRHLRSNLSSGNASVKQNI